MLVHCNILASIESELLMHLLFRYKHYQCLNLLEHEVLLLLLLLILILLLLVLLIPPPTLPPQNLGFHKLECIIDNLSCHCDVQVLTYVSTLLKVKGNQSSAENSLIKRSLAMLGKGLRGLGWIYNGKN